MEQIGYVVEAAQEVKIRVMRESSCGGNCGACHGCPADAVIVTCLNDATEPFEVGEQVVIEMSTAQFLGGTFGSYGVMTVCMLTGAILGYIFSNQEIFSILGGFCGLILGVVIMRKLFQKRKQALKIKRQKDKGKQ